MRSMFLAALVAALGISSTASAQIIIGGAGGIGGIGGAGGGLPGLQKAQLEKMQRELLKGILDPELMKQLQLPLDQEAMKKLQIDPEMLKLLQQLDPNALKGQPGIGGAGGGAAKGQMAWAGMQLKRPAPEDAKNLGLPENEGQVVVKVNPGSDAEKAGFKANDIIVKIDGQNVPSDHVPFAKLVKDHDTAKPMEIVVVRDGKEEKLKANGMPLAVQTLGNGLGGAGGIIRINGLLLKGLNPRPLPPRVVPGNPGNPGKPGNPGGVVPNNVQSNYSATINGAKIVRKQNNADFTGEYSKGDLTITISGKVENGKAVASQITITEKGQDARKYTTINDVPGQYRAPIALIMPRGTEPAIQFPNPFDQ